MPSEPTPAHDGSPPASPDDLRPAAGMMTVTQVTRLVAGAIRLGTPGTLRVLGELSNFVRASAGHLYFTLKDESSEIRCVMWKSDAARLAFQPTDGLCLIATGSIDVYEPRGQYQLYVRKLEPRGVGALELAFRQLREKLLREGLFAPERKRPLPTYPARIAVVTSLAGAAVRDIVRTVARRYPLVHLFLYDVRVQGDEAAAEIAEAIRRVNRQREALAVDVLIVGRGGGSIEDLWAFNEEIVARAIFHSEIPIISAVGHEIDFTIADFVADVRAATPTAAAELVTPMLEDLAAGIDTWAHRLDRAVRSALDRGRSRLTAIERSEWFRDPASRIGQRQQQLDEILGRLRLAVGRLVAQKRSALHDAEVRLTRVRPEALLARRADRLARLAQRLERAGRQAWLRGERRVARIDGRLSAATPLHRAEAGRAALHGLNQRLNRALAVAMERRQAGVVSLEARLAAGSHERVLARGFTITRDKKSGRVVTSSEAVREGQRLTTQTGEGEFDSRVVDRDQGELFD